MFIFTCIPRRQFLYWLAYAELQLWEGTKLQVVEKDFKFLSFNFLVFCINFIFYTFSFPKPNEHVLLKINCTFLNVVF